MSKTSHKSLWIYVAGSQSHLRHYKIHWECTCCAFITMPTSSLIGYVSWCHVNISLIWAYKRCRHPLALNCIRALRNCQVINLDMKTSTGIAITWLVSFPYKARKKKPKTREVKLMTASISLISLASSSKHILFVNHIGWLWIRRR